MVTTHALAGAALALPLGWVAPDLLAPAAAAGFVGGVAPDLDVAVGTHRRTLHFPVLGWAVALPAVALAAAAPGPATAAAAAFLLAAVVHAAADVLGASDSLRPWRRESARGAYDHLRGRWLRPRYLVRYDGAPEDAVLTAGLGLAVWTAVDGLLATVVATSVVVGVAYAAVRRRLPDWVERLGA